MLIATKFEGYRRDGRRYYPLDFGGDSPPPPDYTPLASASEKAAEIGAQLGREQMAESRRQYDTNMAVARPIIDAQTRLMGQAYEQGNTNFANFQNEGRPLQQSMRNMAMGKMPDLVAQQAEIEAKLAGADVQRAADAQAGAAERAAERRGVNPFGGRAADLRNSTDLATVMLKAGATSQARRGAADRAYARMGDVLNTYSGLASSAPTFYSAGTQAGNSAAGAQMGASGQLMGGLNSGASTTMQGQQLNIQGRSSILSSQTSAYNTAQQSNAEMTGALVGAAGAWLTKSDRRLKCGIELVGRDEATGLNLYEFAYRHEPRSRFVGVMADEVQQRYPQAVVQCDDGFMAVDYRALGIELQEVA